MTADSDASAAAEHTRWVSALRSSHDRLFKLAAYLDPAQLSAPSYDSEWSIAQVLSHLGSQAEIFGLFFAAGVSGSQLPGGEVFAPIWAEWNELEPVEQRDRALAANDAFVSRLEELPRADAESFRLDMFGNEVDLSGFARMRLGEHAVHTWDVAVALDPTATVADESVQLLLDGLGQLASRAGKPAEQPYSVLVATTDPERRLLISVGGPDGSVSIARADDDGLPADGRIELPAEAYLRLLYGRLDPQHTPPVSESGSRGLNDLRAAFPGF